MSLRKFLAEKLHCDPMRVSKKYTGAQLKCRFYLRRERSTLTPAELDAVTAELGLLAHLEEEFRRSETWSSCDLPQPRPMGLLSTDHPASEISSPWRAQPYWRLG